MVQRALIVVLLAATSAHAVDIEGVLPASLDQPRIYVAIARDAKSAPLTAKADGVLAEALADLLEGKKKKKDAADEDTGIFAVDAFLDTGASGIILSQPTASALGITPTKLPDGSSPTYFDVGVAGDEPFDIADAYVLRTSRYDSNTEGGDLNGYSAPSAPMRLMLRDGGGLMDELTGGLDVVGMPIMLGKVMVCDARPLSKFDKIRTTLVAPGDKSIPAVDSVISLTYVDFARFTRTEPASAPRPALAASPMIGPSPLDPADKSTPVTLTHGKRSAALTMLLDSGAASSMISVGKAKALGIELVDGKLTNVPEKEQFMLPIGGIGGTKNVPGFFVDVLQLPVAKGEPVRYIKAPLLVLDITITDPATNKPITLDGVFGMNYLVASASVSGGLTGGGIDDIHDGACDQFVIDHVGKTLGLKLRK